MPDLLSIYAGSQPDKLAVVDDRGGGDVVRWTYAELEAEANRLGHALVVAELAALDEDVGDRGGHALSRGGSEEQGC